MAASVEEAPVPQPFHQPHHYRPPPPSHHDHHLPPLHHHHHPPPPHHHHISPPPLFHHHGPHHHLHHHHQPPPPPPFLCTRCKCWNFPANPYFNPSPNFAHPTGYLQAQEFSNLSANPSFVQTEVQAQEMPSDRLDAAEEVEDEEGYELVMTDEWMEFFAKSEARRQEKKRQQKRAARDMRKATRARSQAQEPSTVE